MFEERQFLDEPLPAAMVGGGRGSQIGYAHRNALRRDNLFTLVAGAFDIDPARGRDFGQSIHIDESRCYDTYHNLIKAEKMRPDGAKVIIIATPNNTHYPIAKLALENGFHIICEKPLTFNLQDAQELEAIAKSQGLIAGVMYGYSGYVMVEQMRRMVHKGDIGDVRIVDMQFAHGYHAEAVEENQPGLKWRLSEDISGPSYVLADIGTHCFHMGQLVSGLEVEQLLCMRQSFIPSRAPLEDNAYVLIKYKNGAVGTLWASAVNLGSAHGFKVRIVGEKGSIEWWDEHPNQLKVAFSDSVERTYEQGQGYLHEKAQFNRIGGGHPEGFFDSWANLYRRFGLHMAGVSDQFQDGAYQYPSFQAGIEGVNFVEKAVYSADNNNAWVDF